MTTTIVYGDTTDGYLSSFDPTYAGARNGPADAVTTGTAAYYGQNNNGGTYTVLQTFIRFAYPAVPVTDVVVGATLRLYQLTQLSTGTARDLEIRGALWSSGGLTTSDWRNPAALAASGVFGLVRGVQASQGKWTLAGSESLRAFVQDNTLAEFVLASSRQRAGSTPTTDEGSSIATADTAGTTSDPRLVFTTFPRTRLTPLQGMDAQLSDGSWVMGLRTLGSDSIDLVRTVEQSSPAVLIGTIPIGDTSSTWAEVPASQGLTLTVDSQDNIYVVGRAGDAGNSIRLRAYRKSAGSWTWTAGTTQTQAAPSHNSPINNVTAAWHSTGNGTLVIFLAHAPGEGKGGGEANDLCYLLVSSAYLTTGTGSLLRGSGSAHTAGLMPVSITSGDFSGYTNETGTGLDVTADVGEADWGYVTSFRRSQRIGENAALAVGRYVLLDTGAGFAHASYQDANAYGLKDAGAKVRLLSVGSGQVALVTADQEAGRGLTVEVLQASGLTPGLVPLGQVFLAAESVTGMPDGPAVGPSPAWDAVYSVVENSIWVYYVDTTTPTRLRRTSVDLDTYQATRVSVLVDSSATAAIRSLRVARNARATQKAHVVFDTSATYTRVVDTYNLAPLPPTLTPRSNYDGAAAATFAWTFNDPNTGDTQSAYQLQVVRVSDGVTVLDTGKVLSATPSRNIAGGSLANEETYQWRVMTWDALDVAGAWSDYGTVTTSAGGSVNITDPSTDNPAGVITDDYQVSWSVTGTTQAKARVWVVRNDTGATIYDSDWLTTTGTSHLVTGMGSDMEHTVNVQVENAAGVPSGVGTRLITPSYGTPEVPLVTVTPVPGEGYVLVTVDNPLPRGDRPEVFRNRIFRRRAGAAGPWDVLGETGPSGSFRDYTTPSLVPVEYLVRGESA